MAKNRLIIKNEQKEDEGGGLSDAPNDGVFRGRKSAAWVQPMISDNQKVNLPSSTVSHDDYVFMADPNLDFSCKSLSYQGIGTTLASFKPFVKIYRINSNFTGINDSHLATEYDEIVFVNVGTITRTLTHNDTAVPNNSFFFNSGASRTIAPKQALKLIRIDGKWRDYL